MRGSSSRSGPKPDPNALRRERKDDGTWVTLAEHDNEAPECPLTDPSEAESALWVKLWALPQGTEWARLNLHDEVALYVRYFVLVESNAGERGIGQLLTFVRQTRESLGLSTSGLATNRWRLGDLEPAVSTGPPRRSSTRDRLHVVPAAS